MSRKQDALALLQHYGVHYTVKKSSITIAADQILALNKTMSSVCKPESFNAFYYALRFAATQQENTKFSVKKDVTINDEWLGKFVADFESRKRRQLSLVDEVSSHFVPTLANSSPESQRRESPDSDDTVPITSAPGSSSDDSDQETAKRPRSRAESVVALPSAPAPGEDARQRAATMVAALAVLSPGKREQAVVAGRSQSFSDTPPPVKAATSPYLAPLRDLQVALEALKAEIAEVTDDQFPNKENLISYASSSIGPVSVYVADEPNRYNAVKAPVTVSPTVIDWVQRLLTEVQNSINASSQPKELSNIEKALIVAHNALAVVKTLALTVCTIGWTVWAASGRQYTASLFKSFAPHPGADCGSVKEKVAEVKTAVNAL